MLPQRVRVRCEPDEKQIIKWTAEGAVKGKAEYSATRGHASVAGDIQVSRKGRPEAANQGGTADKVFIRP